LASGHGGNALFVAELGYTVHALDISFAALSALRSEARTRGIDLQSVVADLDYFPLPRERYDLVMVFYFFAPALMAAIGDALKQGGLLFYATFNHRHTSVKPGFKPEYLVPPGGLAKFFMGFDIVLDEPDWGPEENISRFIARKP
jgi:SAM-dependent methyltransferase